jgi:hypothetical protein
MRTVLKPSPISFHTQSQRNSHVFIHIQQSFRTSIVHTNNECFEVVGINADLTTLARKSPTTIHVRVRQRIRELIKVGWR